MRVFIVEDEELIRKGIVSMVDWEAEGFSEVAEFGNAVDALADLAERGADLVITDLFMQSLSGLEMIEMAENMEIDTRFVILTGHGLFEYAQKAVSLGVRRFLTKPIQPEQLLSTVREMRQEILEQKRFKQSIEDTQDKLREYYPIVCRRFWETLVSDDAPGEIEIRRRASVYDIALPSGPLFCLAIGDSDPDTMLPQRLALWRAVEDFFRDGLVFLLDNGSELLAILRGSVKQRELQLFSSAVRENLSMDIWLGVSRIREGLGLLHVSAREASEALKAVLGIADNPVSYYQDIQLIKGEESAYPAAQEEKVLEALRYRDTADRSVLDDFIGAVYECPVGERSLMLLRFQVALYRLAESSGASGLPPFQPVFRPESRREAFDRFVTIAEEIASEKKGSQQREMTRIVEEAQRIMKENYADPSLNISGIARQLHVSQQYLSRLFRSVSGMTCMDFLTKTRMDAAKEILRGSSVKSYEIALMVGYNQPNYFSALFKKMTGLTPKQYRLENGG